eukprot:567368-Amphidinium_carterae.1
MGCSGSHFSPPSVGDDRGLTRTKSRTSDLHASQLQQCGSFSNKQVARQTAMNARVKKFVTNGLRNCCKVRVSYTSSTYTSDPFCS